MAFSRTHIPLTTDDFFFDHPEIADKYSFVTCFRGEPVGFICWDPRNRPEYVEIGHNAIRTAYKGNGFGKAQLTEALRRITVPTLVTAGEHDLIQEQETRRIAAHIPGARLVIVPGHDHGSYIDGSDVMGRLLLDFLATLPLDK